MMNKMISLIIGLAFYIVPAFAQSQPSVPAKSEKKEETPEQIENKQVAIVVFVKGDVKSGPKRLKTGDRLQNGEVIKTGDKSTCDLQITSSKSPIVVRVKEKSTFQLNETRTGETTKFSSVIDTGKAIFNVSKLNSKEKMEIVTPTSTCGVRGTKFETNVRANGKERTLVTEGKVSARARIAKLEEVDTSEHKSLEPVLKSVQAGEQEIEAGNFADFSLQDTNEFLEKSGLKSALDSSEDENFAENLTKTINDPKFKTELNGSFKKASSVNVKKLDPKVVQKKSNLYEELVPIDPHLLNRKGLVEDFLAQRNKERNFISLIRKLQEENETLKSELEEAKKEAPKK